jgi:exosortase D (VPLPA-CTERM-specific)
MSVHSIDRQATATPVWRTSWGLICAAVIAGLLSLWPFWDGLSDLWGWWVTTPEYSHGLLVPPIAAFLVWQRKDRLERIDFTGSWWGLVLVLAGGIALLMGEYGTLYALVQYAYLLTLTGLILSFLGWPAFRVIAVPLLILLFMIPLPQFVSNNLSIRLELLSSQIGVAFIRLLDISVFLEGNVIDLGGYKLQVADACSGLRYLFPLMTLGFLVAYFYKGAFWKKVVLFLSSIPITVMMNSLRIGIIGVTVDRWGIAMAEGFLHEFQGWALFMVSAALMVGEMALLSKIGTEHGTWRQLFGVEFPRAAPIGAPTRMRKAPASFLAAVSLLVGFVICTLVIPRPAEIFPNRTSFVAFPTQVGGWHGKRETLDAVFTDQLKMDDYLFADYVNDGSSINLYISYYNSQRKGEAVHSPRSCAGRRVADQAIRSAPFGGGRDRRSTLTGESRPRGARQPAPAGVLLVLAARSHHYQRIRREVVLVLGCRHASPHGWRHGEARHLGASRLERGGCRS